MEGSKSKWASKTVVTALVGGVSTLLTLFFGDEVGLTPETQEALVTSLVTLTSVGAAVFRVVAKKELH